MPQFIQRCSLTSLVSALAILLAACVTPPAQRVPAPVPELKTTPPAQPTTPILPTTPTPPAAAVKPADFLRPATFAELPGWAEDDLREAWPALMASCTALASKSGWQDLCKNALTVNGSDVAAVRAFMEAWFMPYQLRNLDGSLTGMVTGYYEPLLRGSRTKGGAFQTPLHRAPADLLTIDLAALYPELKNLRLRGRQAGNKVVPYYSRAEMEQQNLLAGKELLWVDNPVEAFFLQVQGSGRVLLEDGKEMVRLAYADQNGHPYRSIGRYLVERGELSLDQASMQGIKAWVAANPGRQQELLNANPSYVFFREEKISDPSKGPKGALGVPLTARRSIAIDPQFIPLGAPVFLSATLPNSQQPLNQLMLAQDTGGAIRNPVRADFFWGFGTEAGELAGKMKQQGQLWVLLPTAMVPGVP